MLVIVSFITFSPSSCESRDVIASFLEKIKNISEVHFKGYHCFITLTDKFVIASINSVRNSVVTGTNLLRKHQMKNICFSLFTFSQPKIQFKTLEHYRHSEEHLTHYLQLLTREKPCIYTDLKNQAKSIMQFLKLHCYSNHKNIEGFILHEGLLL